MTTFWEDFERFLPSTWFTAGITERNKADVAPAVRQTQLRRIGAKNSIALVAAATAVGAILSVTPVTQTRLAVSRPANEAALGGVSGSEIGGLVTPGHWARLTRKIAAAPLMDDSKFVDVPSLF